MQLYSNSNLSDGDVVSVVLTSSETCITTGTATSNSITTTVNPQLTPSVNISSSDDDNIICDGTEVIFTATPVNEGTSPSYQWKLNGNVEVQTAPSYTTSGLSDGDKVQVILTSSETCVTSNTATSNEITTQVNPMETPAVSITSNDADNNFCQGTSVTFTATPINGGNSPSYQWKVNGSNAGSNSANFTTSSLTNRDQVEVVMTSNASCLTTTTATSNSITNTVYSSLGATAPVIAGPTGVCPTNGTVTYSVSTDPNVQTYNWIMPSGFKINSGQGTNSIVVSFNIPKSGSNILKLETSNPCGKLTSQLEITIADFAEVNAGPDQYVCLGTTSVQLAGSVSGAVAGKGGKWDWSYSAGSILSNQKGDLNATYTLPGTAKAGDVFTVKISTNVNVQGCNGTKSDDMKIYVLPDPTASINGTTSICSGTSTDIILLQHLTPRFPIPKKMETMLPLQRQSK